MLAATVSGTQMARVRHDGARGREVHGRGDRAQLAGNARARARRQFEVFSKPPTVTLEALNDRRRTTQVQGHGQRTGQVTVRVFKGKEAKGTEAAKLTATVGQGKWSVPPASALPDETYTAIASEPSAIGNEEGRSEPEPSKSSPSRRRSRSPWNPDGGLEGKPTDFKGEASEPGRGRLHPRRLRDRAGSCHLLKSDRDRRRMGGHGTRRPDNYTAVATEPSAIGNRRGKQTPEDVRNRHKAAGLQCAAPRRSRATRRRRSAGPPTNQGPSK